MPTTKGRRIASFRISDAIDRKGHIVACSESASWPERVPSEVHYLHTYVLDFDREDAEAVEFRAKDSQTAREWAAHFYISPYVILRKVIMFYVINQREREG